jgi:hypothetical protein
LNWSEPAAFIIANLPDQITAFSQATTNYENGKIKLLWTPSANNGSPILAYSVTRDVGGVFFEIYEGPEASFEDTGLEMGKYYNYRVKALNAIGWSVESSILTAIAGQEPDKILTQRILLESQTSL